MRISMKGDYGTRAVIVLAQRFGQGPVQSSEIATRQGIPEPYLDQLLTTLRRGGLIKSTRGPQGGHILTRPPEEISLREVLEVLEGSLSPMDCIDEVGNCSHTATCALREVWQKLAVSTNGVLDSISIGELAKSQAHREARLMYYI